MSVYPLIEVGDLVTADLLASMQSQSYTKQTGTARNTTTTLAADPELTGIPLAVGTWDIDLQVFATATTSNQAIKGRWIFTGTWAATVRNCSGPGSTNTAVADQVTPANSRGYGTDSQDAVYGMLASTAYSSIRESVRGLVVSVAGTLSYQWAQNVSSANNITVQPGSNFTTRRVG